MSRGSTIAILIFGLALLLPQSLAAQDVERPEVVGETSMIPMDDPSLEWAPCNPDDPPKDCEFVLFIDTGKGGPVGGYVRTVAGFVFPYHWHSSVEFWFDFKSRITPIIDGKELDTVPPGTYIQVPAGLSHSARCEDGCRMLFQTAEPFDYFPG